MDPLSIALMAVNVGASVFNNLRNNKQSRNLQIMQQEYTKAAAERNTQRMWQLMREGQELAIELERESQDYRLEEIAKEFDNLLERMTYSEAIKLWPLKVLPIVMKNQSLGSAIGHRTEHIALHCILTPTNCDKFNKVIFPDIEEQLSDFFNLHWSNASSHPILFYSGAWKSRTDPTGVEIKHLSVDLSKLPVLLITPFFKPEGGLVFQIRAWGIGIELDTEIECSDFSYAEKYKCGINYQDEKDIAERTIEEFVPYLQCLIGYIADQYFWACHNESPLLPTLLTMNIVNTDGMPYLKSSSKERYTNLLDAYEKEMQIMPFALERMLSLFEGSSVILDNWYVQRKIEALFLLYYGQCSSYDFETIAQIFENIEFTSRDLYFLKAFRNLSTDNLIQSRLDDIINQIKVKTHCSIIENNNLYLEDIFRWCYEKILTNKTKIHYIAIEIFPDKIVASMLDEKKIYIDNKFEPMCGVFIYENLIIPDFVVLQTNKLMMSVEKFLMFHQKIINYYAKI